jgi:hypothetical protein
MVPIKTNRGTAMRISLSMTSKTCSMDMGKMEGPRNSKPKTTPMNINEKARWTPPITMARRRKNMTTAAI